MTQYYNLYEDGSFDRFFSRQGANDFANFIKNTVYDQKRVALLVVREKFPYNVNRARPLTPVKMIISPKDKS